MKSFRHGMQTASEASSQELTLNPTLDESASETSSTPARDHPTLHETRSAPLPGMAPVAMATGPTADHTVRKKRSRMVVPLAVLEEFSEGSSSREVWSTDDLSEPLSRDRRLSSSSSRSSDASNNAEDDASSQVDRTSPRMKARSKRNTFKRSRSKQASMNGPVTTQASESCIVDLNSNAKDSNSLHNEFPGGAYEELERMVLSDDEDARDNEDMAGAGDIAPDEFAMLRFAEKYFNVHVIHLGYPNTITKTVNIITRKSLNVSIVSMHLDSYSI